MFPAAPAFEKCHSTLAQLESYKRLLAAKRLKAPGAVINVRQARAQKAERIAGS